MYDNSSRTVSDGTFKGGSIERGLAVARKVDHRLRNNLTPTADWYTSEDVLNLEMDRIFSSTWQLVGGVHEVAEPGQFKVIPITGQGEFIITRDSSGVLRALANVCSHRGMLIAEGSGSCGVFRCGYHGWAYDLDGSLRNGPSLREISGFNSLKYALVPAAIETWGAFVFINPNPEAPPLQDFLDPLPEVLATYGINFEAVGLSGITKSVDLEFNCNWKIAVENSIECYHCSTVHHGFRAMVDLPSWQISMKNSLIVQGTKVRRQGDLVGAGPGEAPAGQIAASVIDTQEGMDDAMFHMMFPNNSISLWPGPADSFNFARWVPLTPHRTRWISTRWWPAGTDQRLIDDQWEFMASVGSEDIAVIEGVHKGMCSGSFAGGPYILHSHDSDLDSRIMTRDERGPLRLNQLIVRALCQDND